MIKPAFILYNAGFFALRYKLLLFTNDNTRRNSTLIGVNIMKINGISQTKAIGLYNDYKKSVNKTDVKQQGDSIQISTLGKSLSTYSTDETYVNSKEKIQGIANEISNGTYNRDSKLVAEKMINAVKNNK